MIRNTRFSNIDGMEFNDAQFNGCTFKDISNVKFSDCRFIDCKFEHADIVRTRFINCKFNGCVLNDIGVEHTTFAYSKIYNTIITRSNFINTAFISSDILYTKINDLVVFNMIITNDCYGFYEISLPGSFQKYLWINENNRLVCTSKIPITIFKEYLKLHNRLTERIDNV